MNVILTHLNHYLKTARKTYVFTEVFPWCKEFFHGLNVAVIGRFLEMILFEIDRK